MTKRWRTLLGISVLLLSGALAYLRDPPWLIRMEAGFRPWETMAGGARARWTGGHASFFVRSDASTITMPIRTTFPRTSDSPVKVTLSIDDHVAQQLVLRDDRWHSITLSLPPPGSRRVRRVDIRADRTRPGNRGVLVGEPRTR
jgi:hypothetical protein